MNTRCAIAAMAALVLGNPAVAEEPADDEAESTIRLMDAAEAELPDAVTKEISLPPGAIDNPAAVENAAQGLGKAAENRERQETGQERADEARERGSEMADEARDNRENRGRSEDRPEPPDPPRGRPND